jgi:hypothetical protein
MVVMSNDYDKMVAKLNEDYDKWAWGTGADMNKEINGLTYDEALKAWVEAEVKRKMDALGMLFDPAGGSAVVPPDLSDWSTEVDIRPTPTP